MQLLMVRGSVVCTLLAYLDDDEIFVMSFLPERLQHPRENDVEIQDTQHYVLLDSSKTSAKG